MGRELWVIKMAGLVRGARGLQALSCAVRRQLLRTTCLAATKLYHTPGNVQSRTLCTIKRPVSVILPNVRLSHTFLSQDNIRERVLLVLKLYDKVDPEKL